MTLQTGDMCAFDDCSILHQCKINIPAAFRVFCGKQVLHHKNCDKLIFLIQELKRHDFKKYRFIPSNIEQNLIKTAEELLKECGNVRILGTSFKVSIVDQLTEFFEDIIEEYEAIQKNADIVSIKQAFCTNEKQLKKDKNIPEDDDLQILKTLGSYPCSGQKYIISEDEHFWGYKELILKELNIYAIEEWICTTILS